ncbi:uncharacterized protein PV09_06186 [Verruconis gallopava]|uniref:Uncharacterized protein n=1 Tax=Verruconis gallopava TaxID=253628 RepID=A0A0D2AT89_9PEZI|nr:uncharacterized protein PV09_06186 [Verruconis gallopava]KIW02364.1 hypothetical protein PV09_06186 [Verruconis gallopava]
MMDDIYDNGSLAASLEDFEHDRSPTFNPSLNNSAFRSEESEPDSDRLSAPWSPPVWRKANSGWMRQHRFPPPGASVSHSTSPLYESAGEGDDTLLPSNVPLPPSPPKETPGASPEKNDSDGIYGRRDFPQPFGGGQPMTERESSAAPDHTGNYFRFAMRAEVQHRTDPYDGAVLWLRDTCSRIFRTWTSTLTACTVAFLAWSLMRSLLSTPTPLPTPDMLKATQIARTFEPLIYYSESGSQHISDIQDTSVAVWDLSESVRSSNFTSAPIIVKQLDELSESFKNLAVVLTSFFSNVEGDIDSILIVMEWSKRHLQTIDTTPAGSISSLLDNLHGMLSRIGLLETSSGPTPLGYLVKFTLGETSSQRNAATLRRTFNEFLNVLEDAINNELQMTLKVFGEFNRIDTQLLNIQRTVIRETDQQEREEGEMLSSLWTRLIGTRATELRKFEKNKKLLSSIRETSVQNKHILLDHNGKLLQLKSNLEVLRKKLVSPLVRSNDSSALSVEEQIAGLDDTYLHLKAVRERQRQKTLENLYASAARRVHLKSGANGIDATASGGEIGAA